jgi:DNA-binding NtrC family response regulator
LEIQLVPSRPALDDVRVLLLEDDALISLDTEDMLLSLGAARVHVAHSLEEAESILAREVLDAAVLDLVIGSSRSEDLARRLVERSLPVIFASGYGEAGTATDGLEHVPTVRKPYSVQALQEALVTALQRAA